MKRCLERIGERIRRKRKRVAIASFLYLARAMQFGIEGRPPYARFLGRNKSPATAMTS
jgi:hypothetical protein